MADKYLILVAQLTNADTSLCFNQYSHIDQKCGLYIKTCHKNFFQPKYYFGGDLTLLEHVNDVDIKEIMEVKNTIVDEIT